MDLGRPKCGIKRFSVSFQLKDGLIRGFNSGSAAEFPGHMESFFIQFLKKGLIP
jgi:hypothetical protein